MPGGGMGDMGGMDYCSAGTTSPGPPRCGPGIDRAPTRANAEVMTRVSVRSRTTADVNSNDGLIVQMATNAPTDCGHQSLSTSRRAVPKSIQCIPVGTVCDHGI